MRGIVIQQAVHQGLVDDHQNRSKLTNFTGLDVHHNESLRTLNVPKQALISITAYSKDGQSVIKLETIMLTTTNIGLLPIKEVKKLKVYKKSEIEGSHTLKVESEQTEKIMFLINKECYHFAYTCFWARILSMGVTLDLNEQFINCCEGEVLKKSQFLKVWQPRYLLITSKDGLMSFRDRRDAATMTINSIQQFWTRFELVEGYTYIVFKLWYSIIKEQFAVPLHRAVKWFKAFYSLLQRQ